MKTKFSILTLILFGALFVGCASKRITPITVPAISTQTISFSDPMVITSNFEPIDSNDPQKLVLFGLDLYQKKSFKKAAWFFQKAADKEVKTFRGNRFRLACFEAAAICFYRAGDIEYFHLMMDSVRSERNEFQQARMSDQASLLLAISDKLRGRVPDLNNGLPLQIKHLFKNNY